MGDSVKHMFSSNWCRRIDIKVVMNDCCISFYIYKQKEALVKLHTYCGFNCV